MMQYYMQSYKNSETLGMYGLSWSASYHDSNTGHDWIIVLRALLCISRQVTNLES